MANPLFQAMGGMASNMNLMGMIQQFRTNPMGILKQRFNIPNDLSNPNAIIQHLLNSGQLSQSQYEQARQMAQNFKF